MAYGNWGAFVYRNGLRQKNREDVTPYFEDENKGSDNLVHASLGEGKVRLCGYKNYYRLYLNGEQVAIEDYANIDTKPEQEYWEMHAEGGIEGYKFYIHQYHGDMIQLELTEPDGTKWSCRCGFYYGAGHTDD